MKENSLLKEQTASLKETIDAKDMSLSEFAKQLESIENDRTKLNKMKDDLQQEVTRLTNENNQVRGTYFV